MIEQRSRRIQEERATMSRQEAGEDVVGEHSRARAPMSERCVRRGAGIASGRAAVASEAVRRRRRRRA